MTSIGSEEIRKMHTLKISLSGRNSRQAERFRFQPKVEIFLLSQSALYITYLHPDRRLIADVRR